MRRSQPQSEETAGQDSFLDVITNIVGILIILVMAVGMHQKKADTAKLTEQKAEIIDPLEGVRAAAAGLEAGVLEIEAQKQRLSAELAMREQERAFMAAQIAAGELELERRSAHLDGATRGDWELQNQLQAARGELERRGEERRQIENSSGPVTKIESFPTPISKTVYGKEVHFQLSGGRLAYVPFSELLKLSQSEVQRQGMPGDERELELEVGPVDGFRLAVTWQRVGHQRAELTLAEFLPDSKMLGETLAEAAEPNSQFQSHLRTLDPKNATVTIWFYPDSFAEFREVKRQLFQRGFATAAWPLPHGSYISGSNRGARSSAQ